MNEVILRIISSVVKMDIRGNSAGIQVDIPVEVLQGRLGEIVGTWAKISSWIKFKCKKNLWTGKYVD